MIECPRASDHQSRQGQAHALGAMGQVVGVATGQVLIQQPAEPIGIGGGSRNSTTYW